MKFTLESYDEMTDTKVTVTTQTVSLDEALQSIESLLLASGFVLKGHLEVIEDDFDDILENTSEFEQ